MRPKALVTGASRGIGKAIAYMLAEEGYDLYLVCRYSEKEINGIRNDLISQHGVSCNVYLCDVSDADAVKAFCKEIGEVDVLINNAAVAHVGLLTEMSVTQWKQVIGTNLDALFYTCKYLVPGMVRKKKGKIINIVVKYLIRLGECRRFYRGCLQCSKRRRKQLYQSIGKGACTQ